MPFSLSQFPSKVINLNRLLYIFNFIINSRLFGSLTQAIPNTSSVDFIYIFLPEKGRRSETDSIYWTPEQWSCVKKKAFSSRRSWKSIRHTETIKLMDVGNGLRADARTTMPKGCGGFMINCIIWVVLLKSILVVANGWSLQKWEDQVN